MHNTESPLPNNPILRTANMIKALHWYCGDDLAGSSHSSGKALECVACTPLDDSSEHLAAREELVYWLAMLAIKVSGPSFQDSALPLRLARNVQSESLARWLLKEHRLIKTLKNTLWQH